MTAQHGDGILGDPRPLMPTLPGKATGIVGVDPMVLQCHDCGATLTQPPGRTVAVFIVTSGWHAVKAACQDARCKS